MSGDYERHLLQRNHIQFDHSFQLEKLCLCYHPLKSKQRYLCLHETQELRLNFDHMQKYFGSNNGDSIKGFLSGKQAASVEMGTNGVTKSNGQLRRQGNISIVDSNWEIYAFEANPIFNEALTRQKHELLGDKLVKSYHLYNGTAISTQNGHISLMLDTKFPDAIGSSTMNNSRCVQNGTAALSVRSVDIVTFIRNNFRENDYVVMKMDVEGAEYDIVRRIIVKGLLKYIDKIAVEWHHNSYWVFGHPRVGEEKWDNYHPRVATHRKYKSYFDSIMWLLEGSTEEKEKFIEWG